MEKFNNYTIVNNYNNYTRDQSMKTPAIVNKTMIVEFLSCNYTIWQYKKSTNGDRRVYRLWFYTKSFTLIKEILKLEDSKPVRQFRITDKSLVFRDFRRQPLDILQFPLLFRTVFLFLSFHTISFFSKSHPDLSGSFHSLNTRLDR